MIVGSAGNDDDDDDDDDDGSLRTQNALCYIHSVSVVPLNNTHTHTQTHTHRALKRTTYGAEGGGDGD